MTLGLLREKIPAHKDTGDKRITIIKLDLILAPLYAVRAMNQKLTEKEAREILARAGAGESQQGLAREFRIVPATVSALVTGTTWPHLPRVPRTRQKVRGRKLDEATVRTILSKRRQGTKRRELAVEFHVTEQTISDIERGKTWKHVDRPKPARRRVWEG